MEIQQALDVADQAHLSSSEQVKVLKQELLEEQRGRAEAEQRVRELEESCSELRAMNNRGTSQDEEIADLKVRIEEYYNQAQDLKSQLDRYYTFTVFILHQEFGHTEDLNEWVEFLQSQWRYHLQVGRTLSRQSAQLVEQMHELLPEMGTEALKPLVGHLETHIDYSIQVANRLKSHSAQLSDFTKQMTVYCQRSTSEEAVKKMEGMDLQRDLAKVGYWPLKPSHDTAEAASTPVEKAVEKAVQKSTPAPTKTSGQNVKETGKSEPSRSTKETKKAVGKGNSTQPLEPSQGIVQDAKKADDKQTRDHPKVSTDGFQQVDKGKASVVAQTSNLDITDEAASTNTYNALPEGDSGDVPLEEKAGVQGNKKDRDREKRKAHQEQLAAAKQIAPTNAPLTHQKANPQPSLLAQAKSAFTVAKETTNGTSGYRGSSWRGNGAGRGRGRGRGQSSRSDEQTLGSTDRGRGNRGDHRGLPRGGRGSFRTRGGNDSRLGASEKSTTAKIVLVAATAPARPAWELINSGLPVNLQDRKKIQPERTELEMALSKTKPAKAEPVKSEPVKWSQQR